MVLSFFSKRWRAPSRVPTVTVPAGVRVYAIGDIHGRDDLFADLLEQIDADHRARRPAERILILLGDFVDRGPDSRKVVERAMALAQADAGVRCIAGNHEEIMLLSLDGNRDALKLFCRIGGRETILSYGVLEDEYNGLDYDELFAAFRAGVPVEHITFLQNMENLIEVGDYAFVHAGIKPGVTLAEQSLADLRWIRTSFLEHRKPHERIIVHGHTITEEVDLRPNRIGIDTGAYASGRLTALVLEGSDRWFLQTGDADT